VREQYHVQQPRTYPASEYADSDYDEFTVAGGSDGRGRGRQRQRFREKDGRGGDRGRERGLLIVIAAFVVGLIFCLRESRSRR
jgi:hypothetical protein